MFVCEYNVVITTRPVDPLVVRILTEFSPRSPDVLCESKLLTYFFSFSMGTPSVVIFNEKEPLS